MAYNFSKTWLGFEDEYITDKYKGTVNFTTNKIGGKPDWPNKVIENPVCGVCQLTRPLVLQIYAPLDSTPYHRTLYLFACINPNCWTQTDSWTCIRVQTLEQTIEPIDTSTPANTTKLQMSVNEWCQDADDWEDNNANLNEENGNVVSNLERISDEDDESCSIEESTRIGIGHLTVDDRNANMGITAEAQGGAVGRLHSPRATAEIEGDEGEVISIDTPTLPQHDLVALLQEVTPLPQSLCQDHPTNLPKQSTLQFLSYFISVYEETEYSSNLVDRHVKELLLEYQQKNEESSYEDVDSGSCSGLSEENYEKCTPAHGDKMFHHFLTKINANPGQILRYNREAASPLLIHPLTEIPKKCEYCDADLIFELQVLPTVIPKLQLTSDGNEGARLEFGNVLVFTCRKSCWATDINYRKEVIVLQNEKF